MFLFDAHSGSWIEGQRSSILGCPNVSLRLLALAIEHSAALEKVTEIHKRYLALNCVTRLCFNGVSQNCVVFPCHRMYWPVRSYGSGSFVVKHELCKEHPTLKML